ncbi:MAG: type II glyceraldehyde-3-phosphate dehydrogenase [Proteobacteria bacterium]|nr:type II glyceraldehyde-3-phosphate dehydrogenase [Pseudomonadota bacterium]MBU4597653.1 type II glyceraldehyde-3-phosphate dehydrogenase [Pseudomonadota bacterium]
MKSKVKVAINGYGVIGKRAADAVSLQDDMELVGICDVIQDYRIRVAVERNYPIYAATDAHMDQMKAAWIPVEGVLADLLNQIDIIVDCTPKHIAALNREAYRQAEVKSIFQGGEKHELTGFSFVAQINYAQALDRDTARVVSCNTTALCRVLGALHQHDWIERARVVILRRGTDPWESHNTGMINTVIPEVRVPSHQGPDAKCVIPDLDITTMAAAGPFNLSHIHFAMVETKAPLTLDELRDALWDAPRIALVSAGNGVVALNSVIELMRDLGRPRNDMWEVAVWQEAMAVDEREIYLTYQVHNEAIVIPEIIDCIRAMTGLTPVAMESICKTDESLGIVREFLPATAQPVPHKFGPDVPHTTVEALEKARAEYESFSFKGAEEPSDA